MRSAGIVELRDDEYLSSVFYVMYVRFYMCVYIYIVWFWIVMVV